MKKYVAIGLCGLTAVMLATGCTKKTDDTKTTAATEETTVPGETQAIDNGTIKKLGDYKGLEVTKMSVEATDEEVEAQLQSILQANPEYVEVTGRPAQLGDTVDIDYVGMKDGTAFEGGTAQGSKLELGSGSFIEGFEEGIVGANKGDELSLNLTFPEDYSSAELAGQAVVFDVTVNAIEEKKEAVLDANFVQRMSDFTTVDEFKADTIASIEENKEMQAQQKMEYDILLAAITNSEFDVNPDAIEQRYNSQMESYNSMMQMYGMTMADYAGMYGMTEDQFKEELRSSAEMMSKQTLLVNAIAEKEGMKVEDADRQKLADESGMTIEEINTSYGEAMVDETALLIKVLDLMKENAVIK